VYRSTLGPARMLGIQNLLGSLEVGKPASFIEVAIEDLPSNATLDDAIFALLNTSRRELEEFADRPACRQSLDALVHHGLDIGPQLDCLSDEIARTQRQLDHKVQRVTVAGKCVFDRSR
jgi:hypothetical protein